MIQVIGKREHCFMKGKLSLINLICQESMDVVYLDFSKVFNTASHSHVLDKLATYGLDDWIVIQVIDWQSTGFCSWEVKTREPSAGWICVPGEQPCWEGPGAPGEPGELESASVMLQQQKAGQIMGCIYKGITGREKERLSACLATPKLPSPVLVPPVQERWRQPSEGPKEDWED